MSHDITIFDRRTDKSKSLGNKLQYIISYLYGLIKLHVTIIYIIFL